MDVRFLSSERSEGFTSLKGELDEKLGSIVGRLDRGNFGEIAKEVLANFTKAALLTARKKIFSHIVAKEEEKQALATTRKDATKNDSDDQAALLDQPASTWRLVNRRSKPLIADDVLLLVKYVKYPREPFPIQVLKKPSSRLTKGDANEDTGDLDDAIEEDDWSQEVPEDRDVNTVAASESSSLKKRSGERSIERFIIREPKPVEPTPEPCPPPSVEITKLCDTHTSTQDLIQTRTIATQTADCIVSYKSKGSACVRSRSENSLLDYIDGEFDSLTKRNSRMEPGSQQVTTPATCDRRFRALENKYDEVVKRVSQLERLHAIDSCQLNDNAIRQNYPTTSTQRRPYEASHPTPDGMHIDLSKEPNEPSSAADESVWDPDLCDMYINTQDSQGNRVSTKATPAHLREISDAGANRMATRQSSRTMQQPEPPVMRNISDARPRNARQMAYRQEEVYETYADSVTSSSTNQRHSIAVKSSSAVNISANTDSRPIHDDVDSRSGGASIPRRNDGTSDSDDCVCTRHSAAIGQSTSTDSANSSDHQAIYPSPPSRPAAQGGRQLSMPKSTPPAGRDTEYEAKRRKLDEPERRNEPTTSG